MVRKSKCTERLAAVLARRTFVVYVSRENDMRSLRLGRPGKWTVPKTAKPGDRLIFYKPGRGKGWSGQTKPPYEVFVGAGIVHQKPHCFEPRRYRAQVGELILFPRPVDRRAVADAFPGWLWLRAPQSPSGAQVPSELDLELLACMDRLAIYPKNC
jgi:hypothetical protein